MSDTDDEIWGLFRDEASETLDELTHAGSRLGGIGDGDPSADIELALRLLHNLKGAASVAGSDGVVLVAHSLEDSFEEAARDRSALTNAIARLRDGTGLISRFLGDEAPLEAARAFAGREAPAPRSSNQPRAAEKQSPTAGRAQPQSVRVEASRLDRLMSFTGELVMLEAELRARSEELAHLHFDFSQIERERPEEIARKLREATRAFGDVVEKSRHATHRLGNFSRDFSAAINAARMSPLSGMVPQWRRVVAEAAHALGREVRLVVEMGDVEVDRQIMDGLRDPMMHMLRNAVDHGIEPPEVRQSLGKPRMGTIVVRASAPGMMVELEVSDDGRGFDVSRIGSRAVERGIVTADELSRMSPVEVKNLAFRPGLSTMSHVSEVSGRGVGLDVVEQRLAELGGSARITTPTLGGSTLRLEVPATVVSTRGLLVRAGRVSFVLPIAHVAFTSRVSCADVRVVDGASAVVEEGRGPLRLRWLTSIVKEPRRPDPERLLVVAVSDGASRMGLVVDALIGEIEAVIKHFPWNVPRVPGIAGAMILGTGAVAVVLDVPRLFGAGKNDRSDAPKPAEPAPKRRILVVDDSLTSRTLERNVLVTAGYEVDTENDGEAAWQKIQSTHYDLVVTDIQMPRLDGIELTRRIRAHPRWKTLPVIVATSLDDPKDIARGSEAGADEYIVKGRFDQKILLEAVSRLL